MLREHRQTALGEDRAGRRSRMQTARRPWSAAAPELLFGTGNRKGCWVFGTEQGGECQSSMSSSMAANIQEKRRSATRIVTSGKSDGERKEKEHKLTAKAHACSGKPEENRGSRIWPD
jgi:hypothetical protein